MDLKVRGTDDEMESQSEDQCWLCVSLGCTKAQCAAQVLHTPCCSWPGGAGRGQITPRGWDLEFTSGWLWHCSKDSFTQNCDKVS